MGTFMTEPAVTLTDYGLTLLCAFFSFKIVKREFSIGRLRIYFLTFFLSLSLDAFTGGTVHAFFLDESTLGHRFLWPFTLILIGITGWSCWLIGGSFWLSMKTNNFLLKGTLGLLAIYMFGVLFFTQKFWIAICFYLPASIFLLLSTVIAHKRYNKLHFLWMMAGIIVTFVAAGIQQAKLGIHEIHFNHNAVYHIIQAIGLTFIFKGVCLMSEERKKR